MNRLWLRPFVLVVCLAQFLAISKSSQADDRAGEKLLPKDTLAFFTISDIPTLKSKWDKTSLGQLCHDPQMKPFWDDVSAKIDEESKRMEDEIGVSINDLMELPQGELTFGLVEKPSRKLAVVLILQYGKNHETLDKLLKKMDDTLEAESAEHSVEEIEKMNVHIYTLKNQEPQNPFKALAYFTDDSYLVFSTEVAAIKEVLKRWDGNSNNTLANNDQYKYIQAQCKLESGEPLIKMFVNPIGMLKTAMGMVQNPQVAIAESFLPTFGVDGLKGYGGVMSFDDGDFEGIANFFCYTENSTGLIGLFNFPPIPLTPPKWVPETAGAYTGINWNVLGAYTTIETLVDGFLGPNTTSRYLDSIADQGPMIHPKMDLIDHLDGKIHMIQGQPKDEPQESPQMPDFFLAFGLKDPTKMKKTLDAAAKADGGEIETREFNGETIYEMHPGAGDQTLSMAITEGQLVITNETTMLEAMMRGVSGRAPSLVDSSEYKRIAKYFPTKCSMQSFQRGDAQLKMYYGLLKNADSSPVEGIDFSKLPAFEVISKYLQPSGSYMVPDKKGMKSTSFTVKSND